MCGPPGCKCQKCASRRLLLQHQGLTAAGTAAATQHRASPPGLRTQAPTRLLSSVAPLLLHKRGHVGALCPPRKSAHLLDHRLEALLCSEQLGQVPWVHAVGWVDGMRLTSAQAGFEVIERRRNQQDALSAHLHRAQRGWRVHIAWDHWRWQLRRHIAAAGAIAVASIAAAAVPAACRRCCCNALCRHSHHPRQQLRQRLVAHIY